MLYTCPCYHTQKLAVSVYTTPFLCDATPMHKLAALLQVCYAHSLLYPPMSKAINHTMYFKHLHFFQVVLEIQVLQVLRRVPKNEAQQEV